MKRRLIKQGGGGVTLYLPKKWVDREGLQAGDEVEIHEEESKLVIESLGTHKTHKKTAITLEPADFHVYRSLIGGLYRGGYDEIRVFFKDAAVLPILQKTIDSLYGYEIFDIDEKGCFIRSFYNEEATEISSHIMRMIHTIRTMQGTILENLKAGTHNSLEQVFQLRLNVVKQRDIISRVITRQKLLDDKHFPYYTIGFCLYNIARNYYLLYENVEKGKQYSLKNIDFLEKTNAFFVKSFEKMQKITFAERYPAYEKLRTEGIHLMQNPKEASVTVTFCLNILMAIQSTDSSLLLLNHE